MSTKKLNVTIRGIGYLNGNVNINKTVELDAEIARKFGGANRDEAILELCRIHYPGVRVEKGKVVANISPVKESTHKSSISSGNESRKVSQNKSVDFKENFDDSSNRSQKPTNVPSFSSCDRLLKTAGSFALGSITNSIMSGINETIQEEKERKIEVNEFKSRKNDIIHSEIPKDKSGIFQYANNLIAELKSGGWSDGEDHKNEFANACMSKLEQSKYMLIGIGAVNEAKYIEDEIKKLNRKKFTQKYLAITIGAGILAIAFILYLLGIIHD